MNNFQLTVVIPTCKETELHHTLTALEAQTIASNCFEVQLVENGFRGRAEKLATEFPQLNIRYHFLLEAGANNARNHGITAASSPLIALLDDDCIPAPAWVATILEHAKLLTSQLGTNYVAGGKVNLEFSTPPPAWLKGRFLGSLAQLNWDFRLQGKPWVALTEPSDYVVTANMFFSREAWQTVGGFDPGAGFCPRDSFIHSDEPVFLHKIRQLNAQGLIYLPCLQSGHIIRPWRTELPYFERRFYGQGVADISQQRAVNPNWSKEEIYRNYVLDQQNPQTYSVEIENVKRSIPDAPQQNVFETNFLHCMAKRIEGMLDELSGNTQRIKQVLFNI